MDEKVFTQYYNKLNPKQREAVDTIEGPVMVVAGPGTGKTQILTLRIANLLRKTDTQPEQVLALTFTEAGVAAMRKRLFEIMGVAAYRVPIHTFHGFCNEVIQKFSSHFTVLIGSRPANEVDRITCLQKVFDATELTALASLRSPYHYVKKVLRAISLLKREAMTPDDLSARLDTETREITSASDYRHEKGAHKGKVKGEYLKREEEIVKMRELALLYEKYEAALTVEKLYDFDDMILAVVHALEDDEQLRLMVQEEYQYVLADEHQDANGAQNKVLELISSFHVSPNLFIVGDSKQAIYRFQGASLENFLYFQKRFPEAVLINLEENYRSTQTILDSAHHLITWPPGGQVHAESGLQSNSLEALLSRSKASRKESNLDPGLRRYDKPLETLLAKAGHEERKIRVTEYESTVAEAAAVAKEIRGHIAAGMPPEEIALFTRTNKELATYAQALVRENVAVSVETKEDVLDDPHIEKLLLLLRAACAVGDDGPLIVALHLDCFKIEELDIFLLAREAQRKHVSAWRLLKSGNSGSDLDPRFHGDDTNSGILVPKFVNFSAMQRVASLIAGWAKVGANEAPAVLVSTVATESGLLAQILGFPDAEAKLHKFEVLLAYIESYTRTHRHARLADLAQLLALLDEYNVLEARTKRGAVGKVQLMTAHRAKGLEYDVVYVANATEGNWSGGRSRTDFKIPGLVASTKEEEEADDRRLFFVALTRARHNLHVCFARARDDGGVLFPSRFLSEIPEDLLQRETVSERETLSDTVSIEARATLFATVVLPEQTQEQLKEFVRETLAERGLAVTGLNNYLSCPWKYFYRTLLRVPEPQTVPLMFGNAVHRTLRSYFDAYANKDEGGKDTLGTQLGHELEREAFTDKELIQAKAEGTAALEGYYDTYANSWPRAIRNEFAVDALIALPELELRLTGKLDKVEFLSESEVRVIDYKTGQPKSRNEIEGTTKNSEGDYKRQLVFYKLLLEGGERYNNTSYGMSSKVQPCLRMKTGVIDFVMPNKSGKYVREEFSIEEQEVVEVRAHIATMVQELTTLSFWDKRCGDAECGYCALRKLVM